MSGRGELEIRNLHVRIEEREILRGVDLDRAPGRAARADGPQRLRQVDARQHDHGPPRLRGHRGRDPLQRREHHRDGAARARAARPLPRLPVPGRDPRACRSRTSCAWRSTPSARSRSRSRSSAHAARRTPSSCSTSTASFTSRHLNDGFSGGEKKRAEVLQMAMLAPADRGARRDRLGPRHRRAAHRRRGRRASSTPSRASAR